MYAVFPACRTSCSTRPFVLPFDFLSQRLSDVAANSHFNVHSLCIYSRQKSSVGIIFLWSLYSKALFTMLLLYMPLRLRPLPYILMYISQFLYQEKYPYFVQVWDLLWVGWRGSRFESMRGMCKAVATTVCLMS